MNIVNLEHRCPVCNTLFRVQYYKTESEEKIEGAMRCGVMILTAVNGMGGYVGRKMADLAIDGVDSLVRKTTGRGRYVFRCPKCNCESQINY